MVSVVDEFDIYSVAKRTALLFFVLPPFVLFCLWLWYQWSFRRVLAAAKKHTTGMPTIPLLGHLHLVILNGYTELSRMLIKTIKVTVGRGIKSLCVWIGPHPIIFFFDSTDIHTITSSPKAERENQLMEMFLGNGLFTAMGETHRIKRTHLNPMFSLKNLKHLMPVFNESSKSLVKKLSEYSGKGPVDVKGLIKYVTLRSISCITFGPDIKFETYSEDMKNLDKAVTGMIFTYIQRNFKFWLRSESVLKLLWKSVLEEINSYWRRFSDRPLKELKELQLKYNRNVDVMNTSENKDFRSSGVAVVLDGEHLAVCDKVKTLGVVLDSGLTFSDHVTHASQRALGRLRGEQQPLTLPSVFATMKQKYPDFNDYDMDSDMKTFLFGGSGSTREAISFMLLSLAALPKIQDKLYQEIMTVVGPERDVTLNDIEKMTYLDQVLKETLRKYSVIGFFTRKVIEDLQLSNCMVPAGTTVAVCLLGLHHDPKVFPNPENFDPDRFSPENAAKIDRWQFLPFSYGPKHCIGLKYAALIVKTMAVQVIRKYSISTTMDINNLKFTWNIVTSSGDGFNIEFNDRN